MVQETVKNQGNNIKEEYKNEEKMKLQEDCVILSNCSV